MYYSQVKGSGDKEQDSANEAALRESLSASLAAREEEKEGGEQQ